MSTSLFDHVPVPDTEGAVPAFSEFRSVDGVDSSVRAQSHDGQQRHKKVSDAHLVSDGWLLRLSLSTYMARGYAGEMISNQATLVEIK